MNESPSDTQNGFTNQSETSKLTVSISDPTSNDRHQGMHTSVESYENQDSDNTQESKTTCTEDDNTLESNKRIQINKTKRIHHLIESDSDDNDVEKAQTQNVIDNEGNETTAASYLNKRKSKKKFTFSSDSEDEGKKQTSNIPQQSPKSQQTFKLIDSESEDDTDINTPINEEPLYTLNDKKELVHENLRTMEDSLAALCDPESSEDEQKQVKPLAYKRKKGRKNDEEPHEEKKMTTKEAMEQRKEIVSESQRMLRDSHVSLPYHKPKQRSLKEFMTNRPRFVSAVHTDVKHASAAASMKLTQEHLKLISEKMEEREKQVTEFYKSDDDEDGGEEVEATKTSNNTENVENIQTERNVGMENQDKIVIQNSEIITMSKSQAVSVEDIEKEVDKIANEKNEVQIQTEKQVEIETMDTIKDNTENCDLNRSENLPMEEDATNTSEIMQNKNNSVEYEFNLEDSDEEPVAIMPNTTLELLKAKVGNTEPKLSGAPNYVIDFEANTTKPNEITELMNRFMQHTCKKTQHKASAVELSITSVSQGGHIHKEKVAVKVEDSEVPIANEKPGVKLQKLRNDLQVQMAQKRNELWLQKQQIKKEQQEEDVDNDDLDVYKGEKDDCGALHDILDDEEEEISEGDGSSDSEIEDAYNEEQLEGDIDAEERSDADEAEEIEVEQTKSHSKQKQMKRILQPADDDSDEDREDDAVDHTSKIFHMDSTVSWGDDDDFMPAGQTNSCHTPIKQPGAQSKSELGFLSPVCRLTGLQSFDATGKFLMNSPGSPAIKLDEPSPLKHTGWAKSLFAQSPAKNCDNLDEICSGTFATPRPVSSTKIPVTHVDANLSQDFEDTEPSTQDLMALCSGNFNEMSQTVKETNKIENTDKVTETEKANRDAVDGEKHRFENVQIARSNQVNEEQCIDEDDDRLISQLIDEEELEIFRKKFDSPVVQIQRNANNAECNKNVAKKLHQYDVRGEDQSDDEDQMLNVRKKNKNAIVDSDDEQEEVIQNSEKIDLHEDIDENEYEDQLQQEENEEALNNDDTELGYDSEENEIIVEKPTQKKKLQLKNFVENEAELSESEWGSEDEDEGNLDQMELEEGDTEQFDQKQLRRDLEKIHMRHLLDDDKKNIKVLQELYLGEDEELKGAGRQRQFRWRNIDNVGNEEGSTNNEEENLTNQEEEEDNEEEWRKKRFERELYLQSQKQKFNAGDSDVNVTMSAATNQVLKLGKRVVIQNKAVIKTNVQNPRGSFLARKDEVLVRVAEYTKVNSKKVATKNSKNFVFQSIGSSSNESGGNSSYDDKKRKAADAGTPAALKRLRLTGLSPSNQKKTDKKAKARLFSSNW